jgi:uncharacterized protein (TIRG00374 family)
MPREEIISIRKRFLSFKTILSFLMAFVIMYLLCTRVELDEVVLILSKTNWLFFLTGFFVFYISILLRGWRWHFMLKNLGLNGNKWAISEILFISWFANVIVPAKLGDLYRSYLLDKNYNFSMSKAVGSVFSERSFDMIVLSTLFGVTGLGCFGGKFPRSIAYILLSGFLVTLILTGGLLMMKYLGHTIERILTSWFKDIFIKFEVGTLGSIRNIPLLLLYTAVIWVLEAFRLFFVIRSLDLSLPFMLVIFIALASSLLTALPITPAGLGAVEFAMVGILLVFGVNKNIAMSITILDRLISYWSIIPLGYLTFILSKRI